MNEDKVLKMISDITIACEDIKSLDELRSLRGALADLFNAIAYSVSEKEVIEAMKNGFLKIRDILVDVENLNDLDELSLLCNDIECKIMCIRTEYEEM